MKKRATKRWRWAARFLNPATRATKLGALISRNIVTGEVTQIGPPAEHTQKYITGQVELFQSEDAAGEWAATFPKGTVEVVDLLQEGID